jgi:HYDIN/CFA65/VesB family protein
MKRAMVLGLTIVALSIIILGQTTKDETTNKDRSDQQTAQPGASINPASIDFKDQVAKKASKPQRLTITNTGGKDLYINSVVVDGDNKEDFEVSHDTCTGSTMRVNKSCVIDVVFTPSAAEKRKALLMITDNAIDSPQRVTLIGNGINSAAIPPRRR